MPSTFTLDSYRQELHDLIYPTWFDRFAGLLVQGWYEHKKQLREKLGDYVEQELRILDSMTVEERKTPSLIDGTRQERIAVAAGVSTKEVRLLIRSYEQFKDIKERGWPPTGDNPPPI
ncbi:hypothetical protein [Bremerella sp. P1]|uniref:hypothetical protein n=1 Tax=Bremerella sp. P1 TaxID=3026424 RepID=UPI002368E214|nr:hypothetical protein [Bremerella sp. P1]WDI40132.1 hypothetical protein PSR63_16740 [Bremerella sp. P1]